MRGQGGQEFKRFKGFKEFKGFKKRSRVKPAMRGRNEGVKEFKVES